MYKVGGKRRHFSREYRSFFCLPPAPLPLSRHRGRIFRLLQNVSFFLFQSLFLFLPGQSGRRIVFRFFVIFEPLSFHCTQIPFVCESLRPACKKRKPFHFFIVFSARYTRKHAHIKQYAALVKWQSFFYTKYRKYFSKKPALPRATGRATCRKERFRE